MNELPRPEGEGWEPCQGGWKRRCTPAESARLAEHAKLHRTEWVEKCDGCNEEREVVECLKCQSNCVVCDTDDHDRPQHCTGGGCAADAKGATKEQRIQVQHCNDCCACVDWQKAKAEGTRVCTPECPGRELTIGQIDYVRQLVEVIPVDGDPDGLPVFRWVSVPSLQIRTDFVLARTAAKVERLYNRLEVM